jgi:hypothetical protein
MVDCDRSATEHVRLRKPAMLDVLAVRESPAEPSGMAAVVSDGKVPASSRRLTLYYFTEDKPGSGTSSCTGSCAATWPALTTPVEAPADTRLPGPPGVITRAGRLWRDSAGPTGWPHRHTHIKPRYRRPVIVLRVSRASDADKELTCSNVDDLQISVMVEVKYVALAWNVADVVVLAVAAVSARSVALAGFAWIS